MNIAQEIGKKISIETIIHRSFNNQYHKEDSASAYFCGETKESMLDLIQI